MPVATLEEIAAMDPADTDAIERMIAEDRIPSWRQLNQNIAQIALGRNEWAGMPMPFTGLRLTIEDRNPWKEMIEAAALSDPDSSPSKPRDAEEDDYEIVNIFYNRHHKCQFAVCKTKADGRAFSIKLPFNIAGEKIEAALKTMSVTTIWSVDAEMTACESLACQLGQTAREHYFFTGMFLETSKRSGVTYLFRRLRPTIAMRSDPRTGQVRYLAALCLHPIAFYEGTHAGSMVPTDDVLAHLLLMRADEHLFWRRANQHPINSAEAGL